MVSISKNSTLESQPQSANARPHSNYTISKLHQAACKFNQIMNENADTCDIPQTTALKKSNQTEQKTHTSDAELLDGYLQQSIDTHRHVEPIIGKSTEPVEPLIPEISKDIVDRILVNDSRFNSNDQVRIILNSQVLPDTEIHISKISGKLQIDLQTGSSQAYQILNDHKGLLLHNLESSLDRNVVVNLSHKDVDQEQNQGRSRNRIDLEQYIEATDS